MDSVEVVVVLVAVVASAAAVDFLAVVPAEVGNANNR